MPADYDGDGITDVAVYRPLHRRLDHPDLEERVRDQPHVPVGLERRRAGAGRLRWRRHHRPRGVSARHRRVVHPAVHDRLHDVRRRFSGDCPATRRCRRLRWRRQDRPRGLSARQRDVVPLAVDDELHDVRVVPMGPDRRHPGAENPIAYAMAAAAASGGSALANLVRASDFDGDGQSDLTVYRPSTGTWFTLKSSTNYTASASFQLGVSTDLPVTGDFDGDGRTDVGGVHAGDGHLVDPAVEHCGAIHAVSVGPERRHAGAGRLRRRRQDAIWRCIGRPPARGSSCSRARTSRRPCRYQWGLSGDVPVPGDYDGDGMTDLAVYRPSTGEWFILQSTTGFATSVTFQWGLERRHQPCRATTTATARPTWRSTGRPPACGHLRRRAPTSRRSVTYQWGLSGDVPVPGDFDGDGRTDLAVFRPSTGMWFLLKSSTAFTNRTPSGDCPETLLISGASDQGSVAQDRRQASSCPCSSRSTTVRRVRGMVPGVSDEAHGISRPVASRENIYFSYLSRPPTGFVDAGALLGVCARSTAIVGDGRYYSPADGVALLAPAGSLSAARLAYRDFVLIGDTAGAPRNYSTSGSPAWHLTLRRPPSKRSSALANNAKLPLNAKL